MKNFVRIMGLLFGSAGAHTYQNLGKLPPTSVQLLNAQKQQLTLVYMGGGGKLPLGSFLLQFKNG